MIQSSVAGYPVTHFSGRMNNTVACQPRKDEQYSGMPAEGLQSTPLALTTMNNADGSLAPYFFKVDFETA